MNSGFVGTEIEDFFDFPDDITEEELFDIWTEWTIGLIDGGFVEITASRDGSKALPRKT